MEDCEISNDIIDQLRDRNLNWFLAPKDVKMGISQQVNNSKSITLIVYENERWSSIANQWGNVPGVHLKSGDRKPFTDETGKNSLGEYFLNDLKPLNGFVWTAEWNAIVDSSTNNIGYHYAADWSQLSDKKKCFTEENKTTTVRRRRWKRSMIYDYQNQIISLPFILTIKIKSATFTSKVTPSNKLESYVELYIDNVLYDKTPSGTPNWNKTIVKEFLYLEPETNLLFKLYRKVMSGFVLKGVLSINIRDLALTANKGSIERNFPLSDADQKRFLQVEFDLKEFKFFSIQKVMPSEAEELLVKDAFNKIPPSLWAEVHNLFPSMSNISDIIIDSLTEIPDLMRQQDISDIIFDIYRLKQQSVNKCSQTVLNQISSDFAKKTITYPYGKYYYSKCIAFNTLLGISKDKKSSINDRQLSIDNMNYALSNSQPVKSSIFDLDYENYLTSDIRNNVIKGYDINILTKNDDSYELHWQNLYDYLIILKELSRIRFLKFDGHTSAVSMQCKYITDSSRALKDITLSIEYESECIRISNSSSYDAVQDSRANRSSKSESRRLSHSTSSMKSSYLEEEEKIQIVIPFAEIETIEINYSCHANLEYVLDITITSVSAHLLRTASSCYLQIDSANAQHQLLTVDTSKVKIATQNFFEPAVVTVNKTFKILVSEQSIYGESNNVSENLYFTFHAVNASSSDTQNSFAKRGSVSEINVSPLVEKSQKKKRLSKLFSFGSSKSPKSNVGKESPSTKQSPEPGGVSMEESNNSSLLCGKVKIPISSLTGSQTIEKLETLTFQNIEQQYSLKLNIIKVDDLVPPDNCEFSNPCFVLYFADKDGKTLQVKSIIDSNKKNISKASYLSNNGIRSGYFYKSFILEKTVDPIWNDVIEISSSIFPDIRNLAKYVITEFWDKTTSGLYECLGEVYIPIFSALNDTMAITSASKKAIQLSKNMKFKQIYKSETERVFLGSLHYHFTTNEINHHSKSAENNQVVVNIKTILSPIKTTDCCWPCRILSSVKKEFEDFVLRIYVGYNGIVLKSFADTNSKSGGKSEMFSILHECLEQSEERYAHNGIHLMIPYHQVVPDSVFILTDSMIHISLLLMRKIPILASPESIESIRFKGFKLDLIIGPCVASDIYSTFCNRIKMQNLRDDFIDLTSNKFDTEAKVDTLLNSILYEVYSSTQLVKEYSNNIKKISQQNFEEPDSPSRNIVKKNASIDMFDKNNSDYIISLRLFIFQKTWIRIYMWSTIEIIIGLGVLNYKEYTNANIDILTKDAKRKLKECEDDAELLLGVIGNVLEQLQTNLKELFIQNFNRSAFKLVSELSSKLVFNQYLLITYFLTKLSLSENLVSNPQFKRELIVFIITHDNLFEQYLNVILTGNGYIFSEKPLLSTYMNFDQLISDFATLLNDNIKQWNSRTLRHFLTNEAKQDDIIPWDITTIIDNQSNKELYISNIPETIQMQLNIQIGLKKIPILEEKMSYKILQRINSINRTISAAIAKSYIGLSAELEAIIVKVSSLSLDDLVSHDHKDDIIYFFISVVNDCSRIITKHIQESMESFSNDENEDNILDDSDIFDSNVTTRTISTVNVSKLVKFTTKRIKYSEHDRNNLDNLFFQSSKAIESVAQTALNLLSNQIFFNSDMNTYFLIDCNDYFKSIKELSDDENISNSPIEIISATLSEFFLFTGKHMNMEDNEMLIYICIKKLVIRYLIFLRDLLLQKNSGRQNKSKSVKISENMEINDSNQNLIYEHSNRIKMDVKSILLLYSNTILKIRESRNVDSEARGDSNDSKMNSYSKSISNVLTLLSNTSMHIISSEINEATDVEKILKSQCFIVAPSYTTNSATYSKSLTDLFTSNSIGFSVNVKIKDNTNIDNDSIFIQISDMSCINLAKSKNCFMRILYEEQIQDTAIRENVSTVSFGDVIIFGANQDFKSKSIMIQVMEFKVSQLSFTREKLLGCMMINLASVEISSKPTPLKFDEFNDTLTNFAANASKDNPYFSLVKVGTLSGWFGVEMEEVSSRKSIFRTRNSITTSNNTMPVFSGITEKPKEDNKLTQIHLSINIIKATVK